MLIQLICSCNKVICPSLKQMRVLKLWMYLNCTLRNICHFKVFCLSSQQSSQCHLQCDVYTTDTHLRTNIWYCLPVCAAICSVKYRLTRASQSISSRFCDERRRVTSRRIGRADIHWGKYAPLSLWFILYLDIVRGQCPLPCVTFVSASWSHGGSPCC